MKTELLELIKLFLPLIILNYAMAIFCLVLIWKKGTQNLTPLLWTLIVLIVNGFGAIAFLLLGRKRHHDSD